MEDILPPPTETGSGFERVGVCQFTIFLENRVGRLTALLRALEDSHQTVNAISVDESADSALVRMICTSPEQARISLRAARFSFSETDVLVVMLPKRGSDPLGTICSALLTAEINVHYVYAMLRTPMGPAIALSVDDPVLAAQILVRKRFTLIGESDFKADARDADDDFGTDLN